MQPIQKQRNSNLELYRIIVMLLIVAHHSVFHSGVMEEMAQNPLCAKSFFFYVFGMWGRTGIDVTILLRSDIGFSLASKKESQGMVKRYLVDKNWIECQMITSCVIERHLKHDIQI